MWASAHDSSAGGIVASAADGIAEAGAVDVVAVVIVQVEQDLNSKLWLRRGGEG